MSQPAREIRRRNLSSRPEAVCAYSERKRGKIEQKTLINQRKP